MRHTHTRRAGSDSPAGHACPAWCRRCTMRSGSWYLWLRARRIAPTRESSGLNTSRSAYPDGTFAGSRLPIPAVVRGVLEASRSIRWSMRWRSSASCAEVSRVSMRPLSDSCHTDPASSRTGSGCPVVRSMGRRAPARAMIGVPVVAEADALSVSVAAGSRPLRPSTAAGRVAEPIGASS
ncbi:hypothetical protein C1I97_09710 [Streptomyces sp. NTH33]|nr:hypothetical protein C1I97_09710 [Streptomyces sp. NTH33]